MDDGVFSNQISDKRCRICGRLGCKGGAECLAAAERRA